MDDKRVDPGDEIRSVGEIEIVDALRDACLYNAIAVRAMGLERTAGVDNNVGPDRCQISREVAVAVERKGRELGRRVAF